MASRKRKSQSQPTASPKRLKSQPIESTQPRTTFLTLPHELRQAIFLYAQPYHDTFIGERELIRNKSSILNRVHPDIIQDVEYAEKRWMSILTAELRKAGYGSDEDGVDSPWFELRVGILLDCKNGVFWMVAKSGDKVRYL